jgi:hypothetical protein
MSDNHINNVEFNINGNIDDIFKSIIIMLKNYIENNKKDEEKLKKRLKQIYINILNTIFQNPNDNNKKNFEIQNIKYEEKINELKKKIKELKEKAIFIPENNEKINPDIKSFIVYLKSKLKKKKEEVKIKELKYIYYIEEQNRKISKLKQQLFQKSLKDISQKKLKEIRLFPNLKQFSEEEELKEKIKMKQIPLQNIKSDLFYTTIYSKRIRNKKDLKQAFSENNIHHTQIKLNYDFNNYQERLLTGRLKEKPKNIEQYSIFNKIKEFNTILSEHNHFYTKRPLKISLKNINEKYKISSN